MVEFKNIVMVGTGYVGLVTGSCFAKWGHRVTCVDIDRERIKQLNKGNIPFFEPDLSSIVETGREAGTLRFTDDMTDAVKNADCVFIAVGTPARPSDGMADLSGLFCAIGNVTDSFDANTIASRKLVIIIKSTVPPGTGDRVQHFIQERRPELDVAVVSNPEFLREGTAINDFEMPDRIVIGGDDTQSVRLVDEIYRPKISKVVQVISTSRTSAELIKYAANAFLAVKIGFINQISDLCEATGANVADVACGIGSDPRIGMQFLEAGPGYGGSCFPKDTLALVRVADEHGVDLSVVKQTVLANDARRCGLVKRFTHAFGRPIAGARIAVLGLTFKADTDDMRDSPAVVLVEGLQKRGALVHAHDPKGMKQASRILRDVNYFNDPYSCVQGCDAVIFMTGWSSLRTILFDQLAAGMRGNTLVDFRRMIDADEARQAGFDVHVIGEAEVTLAARMPTSKFVRRDTAPTIAIAAKTYVPTVVKRNRISPFHLNGLNATIGENRNT